MFERIKAVMKKEQTMILRDHTTLALSFILPLFQIILFGFAISLSVKHIPMVVMDQSMDSESRAYLDSLTTTGYFDVAGYVSSQAEAKKAIDENRALVAVIIPPDLTAKIERGDARVLVLVDGADPFVSLSAYYNSYIASQNHAISILFQKASQVPELANASTEPLQARTKILYNPDMADLWFVIPSMIALIIQIQSIALVANTIVKEREVGTMEQILVTPLSPIELLVGKLVPNVGLILCTLLATLYTGILFFHVPFKGNMAMFLLMSLIYIFSSVGLGLLISTISKNQKQAAQYNIALAVISLSVSGFVFPRKQMPVFLQWVGNLFPITYYVPIVRGEINKGVGMSVLGPMVYILILYTALIMFLASKAFKKKLD